MKRYVQRKETLNQYMCYQIARYKGEINSLFPWCKRFKGVDFVQISEEFVVE